MLARFFTFIFCLLLLTVAANPVDLIAGQEYEGTYTVSQQGKTFDYLDSRSGKIVCIFFGSPNRDAVNSLQFILFDPKYDDGQAVLVIIKDIIRVNETTGEWKNSSHSIIYSTLYKQREENQFNIDKVNSTIAFQKLQTQSYTDVIIKISMSGQNFNFTAQLTYYDQVLSTMAYSLYVSGVVSLQIYSAFVLLRAMEGRNFALASKLSLLTLSLCNIMDFSETMEHIQYIMSSQSGYLFFVLPGLAYIILFIIFDMKMLFLVWRCHNLANIQNPQLLRKKLTAFYIQFYLGLFLYLTLSYFFANQFWLIILRNLILVPQIIHNVRIGQKPSFNPFYVFGYIGSRLLIPAYERICPENRFHLTPNITLVVVLFFVLILETILLALQNRLGSRFFVPKRFLPNYYNYKLKLKAQEHMLDYECTICLQNLFDSEMTERCRLNSSSTGEELLGVPQVTVMNTPCGHKFHEQCLLQWIQVKLECPTCRSKLPPIQ